MLVVKVKNVRRGNARLTNDRLHVTIPKWSLDRSDEYGTYYICHEMAHITCWELFGSFAHDAEFKAIEDMYLADFGLVVERKKAYPKRLFAFGQKVYEC